MAPWQDIWRKLSMTHEHGFILEEKRLAAVPLCAAQLFLLVLFYFVFAALASSNWRAHMFDLNELQWGSL